MTEAKKYSVAVTAHSTYLPDQSDEEEDRYVFAYTIRITNNGNVPAQLVSRHWIITDAENQVQEVRGMGVVGEQPTLKPGDTFEYSSGSSIPTAVGTMRGTYQMVAEDGTRFEAPIPEFTLSVPRVLHGRASLRFFRQRPPHDRDGDRDDDRDFEEDPAHPRTILASHAASNRVSHRRRARIRRLRDTAPRSHRAARDEGAGSAHLPAGREAGVPRAHGNTHAA
jgi:ApaG protein